MENSWEISETIGWFWEIMEHISIFSLKQSLSGMIAVCWRNQVDPPEKSGSKWPSESWWSSKFWSLNWKKTSSFHQQNYS
jgi:hypothetical protein